MWELVEVKLKETRPRIRVDKSYIYICGIPNVSDNYIVFYTCGNKLGFRIFYTRNENSLKIRKNNSCSCIDVIRAFNLKGIHYCHFDDVDNIWVID